MKKLILIIIVAFLLLSCSEQKTFQISGTLTDFGNPDGSTLLYLKTGNASEELVNIDSTFIAKDGTFVLKGKSNETDLYFLADRDNVFFLRIFVEAGNKITVTGSATDFSNIVIEGSPTQALYNEYLSLIAPTQEKIEDIRREYSMRSQDASIPEAELQAIQENLIAIYEQLEEDEAAITFEFISANSNTIVATYIVYRNTSTISNSAEIEEQFQLLDANMNNKFVKLLKERMERVKLTEVGAILANIELPDSEGTLFSLESLRGKYVLVDFWASWCGPCIREIPNLKKAYAAYQNKGFEILSISLDNDKDAWTNGIAKHELNWINVSDLQAFKSPVAKQMAVNYVPHTFLLDPAGIILAVDLRGEDLENMLQELLP